MKNILIVILGLFLASCGANYHLKRMAYHERKAIEKGASVIQDTVYIEKSILVSEVKTDTVFQSDEGDTIFISKDKLKIMYIDLPGDSVYIEGKCEADTIYQRIPVTITKTIKAGKGFWYYFWRGLGLTVIAFVAGYLTRAIAKKQVNINIGKEPEK